MISELQEAITLKKVVSIFFHGDGGYRRLEPFCLGKTKDGIVTLLAFQVGGFSNTFTTYGWKLFRVECMMSIELTDEYFVSTRPGYNQSVPVIQHVFYQVR